MRNMRCSRYITKQQSVAKYQICLMGLTPWISLTWATYAISDILNNRGSTELLKDHKHIINIVKNSDIMRKKW